MITIVPLAVMLPTKCIYVFCLIVRINGSYVVKHQDFIMEVLSIFCEIGTNFLNSHCMKFVRNRVNK